MDRTIDEISEDALHRLDAYLSEAVSLHAGISQSFKERLVTMYWRSARETLDAEKLDRFVLRRALAKEIGFRRRNRHYVPPNEPRQVLGDDEFRIDETTFEIAAMKVTRETHILPSVEDRGLVGRSALPGASHLNPYLWVQVIERYSAQGDFIWEVAPSWVSSASEVGKRMSRRVLLVQPPGGQTHEVVLRRDPHRAGNVPGGAEKPSLLLVPLPVPDDAFSLTDNLMAYRQTAGHLGQPSEAEFCLWPQLDANSFEVQQVEFALDLDAYLKAVVFRLHRISECVEIGTKIAVVAPLVLGAGRAVEAAIQREFKHWKLVERTMVHEEGGKKHVGNGTPLLGDALTVWEVR